MKSRSASTRIALAAALAIPVAAEGSAAQRLTDLFTEPVPGALIPTAPPASVGGVLFFPGWDPKNQWAMWASDGSSDRATLLRNARAGTPVAFGGRAFYIGSDATASRLWASDGSPGGTYPVAEVGGAYAYALTAASGALYLKGGDSHPWVSDGTAAGTRRLSDRAGVEGDPAFLAWNGAVWFLALGDDGRLGLWSTMGTPESTGRAADLGPADDSGRFAYGLTAYLGRLYFYTSQSSYGGSFRLWTSDGTEAGTTALRDFPGTFPYICPGPCFGIGPQMVAGLGGGLLFFADDGVHGRELWRSDGTTAGTQLLVDIAPGAASSAFLQDPRASAATASYAVFGADDGVHGVEPWVTDGTAAGTHLLADLSRGADASGATDFVAVDGTVFFSGADAIWRTDGTVAGTSSLRGGAATLYPIDGGFAAVDAGGIWVSNGGALALVDGLARPRGLDPLGMTAFGGAVAFSRLDDDHTLHDLWLYGAGTAAVLHHFVALSTLPSVAGGAIWLGADDGVHGAEPWVSDGTASGTRLLHDIAVPVPQNAGALSSYPIGFTAAGNRVYFTAWDGANGEELWTSDGTDSGTRIVEDFTPGPDGSVPGDLTPFQGALAFSVAFPFPGGLWRTDGAQSDTREIAAVGASRVVVAGSTLFFVGFEPQTGSELWRSDGRAAGTHIVRDIVPGPASLLLYALTPAGDRVFFIAQAPDHLELWVSDGTEAGTKSLASLLVIDELTAVGDSIFFVGADAEHGIELWESDGTPEGTRLVRDVVPGPASSSPSSLAAVGSRVFFAADDGEHGIEPWVSDGTADGTRLLEDLSPGPESSSPGQFRLSADLVYFRASDDDAGAQLWSMAADASGDVPPGRRPRPTRVVPPR